MTAQADSNGQAKASVRRAAGREMFGVTGRFEYGPLREALRGSGLQLLPAVLLALLGSIFPTQLIAWVVLDDRMSSTLGTGSGSLLPIVALLTLAAFSLPVLDVAERVRSRVALALLGGFLGAAAVLMSALASGRWSLVLSASLAGLAAALTYATHYPLLMDIYRPEVRARIFSIYGAVVAMAVAVSYSLVAAAARAESLTWRAALLDLAAGAGGLTLLAMLVREVPRHRWDGARFARLVEREFGGYGSVGAALTEDEVAISGLEKTRRVLAVATARPVLMLVSVSGLAMSALPAYGAELLRSRFSLPFGDGAGLLAWTWLGALPALLWWARRAEIFFRACPARLLGLTGWAGAVAGVALAVAAVAPTRLPILACLALVQGGLAVVTAGAALTLLTVVLPRYRAHAAVLLGLSTLLGAVLGSRLMDMFSSRFGVHWGLLVGAAIIVLVTAGLRDALPQVEPDVQSVVIQLDEALELSVAASQGRHLPLLACRQLDFSYGQLQVLFGVDFTVDDGEMVALLGTNGAGKSTLLRAISGLSLTDRGSIHYRGRDITYVGADRRVQLGITQVPGGRAVFGAMTVIDNLRVYGYTCGRDRKAVETGIEVAFDAFPRLAERSHQLAATLSGGEQQMLGLAKALILRPRLLLIDELSLGLAPLIVGELLEMVRRINAEGAAVVLVEQSVNIALSLVDHAYFMEKGEMRFDGKAADLLTRPDLLRSVFLEGAAKGMA